MLKTDLFEKGMSILWKNIPKKKNISGIWGYQNIYNGHLEYEILYLYILLLINIFCWYYK